MNGSRGGFTLIELLVVVIVVAILAAIAMPRFSRSREKTFFAEMQSDLKNLASAQEIYYANNGFKYAGGAGSDVPGVTGLQFVTSKGVTITLQEVVSNGWSALAVHASLAPGQVCSVFFKDAAPVAPAATPGMVTCTGEH